MRAPSRQPFLTGAPGSSSRRHASSRADLWRSPRPGEDDAFDAARFCTWLEVLLEAGAAWQPVEAAERVLELCDAGLRAVLEREVGAAPDAAQEALVRWGARGLFRIAWATAPRGRG